MFTKHTRFMMFGGFVLDAPFKTGCSKNLSAYAATLSAYAATTREHPAAPRLARYGEPRRRLVLSRMALRESAVGF